MWRDARPGCCYFEPQSHLRATDQLSPGAGAGCDHLGPTSHVGRTWSPRDAQSGLLLTLIPGSLRKCGCLGPLHKMSPNPGHVSLPSIHLFCLPAERWRSEPILPFVQILMDSDGALTYRENGANYPGHELGGGKDNASSAISDWRSITLCVEMEILGSVELV